VISAAAATAAEKYGYSPSRLGQVVQRLRDAKGWTQAELAEDADMSREVLAHIEQGKRRVYLDAVLRVAQALGVPFTVLLACAQESPADSLKRGDRCLLVLLPQQNPVLFGRFLRRTATGCRVRIEGPHKGGYIVVTEDQVRRLP